MRHIATILFSLTTAVTLGACSGNQPHDASGQTQTTRPAPSTRPAQHPQHHTKRNNTMTLTGTLKMRGGGRMAHLEIVTDHGNYQITNPDAFGLTHKQNQTIRLKARLIKKAVGPGMPAQIEVVALR